MPEPSISPFTPSPFTATKPAHNFARSATPVSNAKLAIDQTARDLQIHHLPIGSWPVRVRHVRSARHGSSARAPGHGAGGRRGDGPAGPCCRVHGGGHAANHQQQLGGHERNTWVGNDANTLLVVATLITTLTYQLGTSIPGGYWQDTKWQPDGKVMYRAGDPIMRELHRPRYWVFMAASWVGFGSSMVMTLSLLVWMAADSRHVQWSFAVAYSSLVLTFVVSQPRTHLSIDLLVWAAVVAFLWIIISVRPDHRARILQALCCNHHNN